ncbi:hypothetical protein G7009_16360 [Pseudomonas capeferrum]|nr:hypothetical protein [Pseudomonas capeferrum]
MYFNSGGAYTAAALSDLSVAFLPRAEAELYFARGLLTAVLPDWRLESIPPSLVYPYTRYLSARVMAFTDWVTALMQRDQLWKPEQT